MVLSSSSIDNYAAIQVNRGKVSGVGNFWSFTGCVSIFARECVDARPFGELISVSKLSTITRTIVQSPLLMPRSLASVDAANAADFLNRKTSSQLQVTP